MDNMIVPNGSYKLAKRIGDVVYTSGITPKIDGELIMTGKISAADDISKYKEIAEQTIKNAIYVTDQELTLHESVTEVVDMTVYINASDDFTQHARIADFASDYLFKVFGEDGLETRTAVGVSSLPDNSPIEIKLITAVK